MISALLLAQAAPPLDPVVDSLLRAGPLGICIVGLWLLWPRVAAWRAQELQAAKDRDAAFMTGQRELSTSFAAANERISTAFSSANERILDRADKMHERSIAAIDRVQEELHGLRADVHSLTTGTFARLPVAPAKE